MLASNIDDVITQLEGIIAECIASKSRLGYFAALYLKVTKAVKQIILDGQFQDGARLEKLDVVFANRYLEAYQQWKGKQRPSASWVVAFEQAEKSSILVLQHLLLGMNAHINFDLGIAAAEVCADQPISTLKADFDAINMILAALTNQVLSELGRVSPLLSLLGLHATRYNSALIQFSMGNARDGAWCFAEELATRQGSDRDQFITQRDATITTLAESLVHSTGAMRITIWLIHLFEWHNPTSITKVLYEYEKQKIIVNTK